MGSPLSPIFADALLMQREERIASTYSMIKYIFYYIDMSTIYVLLFPHQKLTIKCFNPILSSTSIYPGNESLNF